MLQNLLPFPDKINSATKDEWQFRQATVSVSDSMLMVRFSNQETLLRAQLASSVLLQPQIGDVVLVALDGQDCWLLSVLQRRANSVAELAIKDAKCTIFESEELRFNALSTLHVRAHTLDLQSENLESRFDKVSIVARVVQAAALRLQLWANLLQSRSRSISVRAEQRITRIAHTDQLYAEEVVVESEELIRSRSRQIVTQAKENVRIDGKQIVMG